MINRADIMPSHDILDGQWLGAIDLLEQALIGAGGGDADVRGDHLFVAIAMAQRRNQLGTDLAERPGDEDFPALAAIHPPCLAGIGKIHNELAPIDGIR